MHNEALEKTNCLANVLLFIHISSQSNLCRPLSTIFSQGSTVASILSRKPGCVCPQHKRVTMLVWSLLTRLVTPSLSPQLRPGQGWESEGVSEERAPITGAASQKLNVSWTCQHVCHLLSERGLLTTDLATLYVTICTSCQNIYVL